MSLRLFRKRNAVMTELDIYYDFSCPYCYLAKTEWEQVVADAAVEACLNWRSFQLAPDAPAEGRNYRKRMTEIAGSGERLDESIRDIHQRGDKLGLKLGLDSIERLPNTLLAHCLATWFPASQRSHWIDTVYRAYLCDGRDIGQRDVLAELLAGSGADHLLDRLGDRHEVARVSDQIASYRRAGISSVPTLIADGEYRIQGSDKAGLQRLLEELGS